MKWHQLKLQITRASGFKCYTAKKSNVPQPNADMLGSIRRAIGSFLSCQLRLRTRCQVPTAKWGYPRVKPSTHNHHSPTVEILKFIFLTPSFKKPKVQNASKHPQSLEKTKFSHLDERMLLQDHSSWFWWTVNTPLQCYKHVNIILTWSMPQILKGLESCYLMDCI